MNHHFEVVTSATHEAPFGADRYLHLHAEMSVAERQRLFAYWFGKLDGPAEVEHVTVGDEELLAA